LSTPFEIIGLIDTDEITISNKFKELRHRLLNVGIQSEFLDFTIWGMLGNYFSKNIEAIEFENEILRIFRQLEDLKYLITGVEGSGRDAGCVSQFRSGLSPLNRQETASTSSGNVGRPRMRQV